MKPNDRITLTANIDVSERAASLIEEFDQQDFFGDMMDGKMTTIIPVVSNADLPSDWTIGLIYGPSGTGKSSQIAHLDLKPARMSRAVKPICDIIPNDEVLFAAGMNNLLANLRPYFALSNGQKHRVDIALALHKAMTNDKIYVVDEFTSVLDRHAAYAVCAGINTLRRRNDFKGRLVFATPHDDIAEWLGTDWEYNLGLQDYQFERSASTRRDYSLSLFDDSSSQDQD